MGFLDEWTSQSLAFDSDVHTDKRLGDTQTLFGEEKSTHRASPCLSAAATRASPPGHIVRIGDNNFCQTTARWTDVRVCR